jgi:hypothetical protein
MVERSAGVVIVWMPTPDRVDRSRWLNYVKAVIGHPGQMDD